MRAPMRLRATREAGSGAGRKRNRASVKNRSDATGDAPDDGADRRRLLRRGAVGTVALAGATVASVAGQPQRAAATVSLHADTHAVGGTDAVAPSALGAAAVDHAHSASAALAAPNTFFEQQSFMLGAIRPTAVPEVFESGKAPWRWTALSPDPTNHPNWHPMVLSYNFDRVALTTDDPTLPSVEWAFMSDFGGRMEFTINSTSAASDIGGAIPSRPFGVSFDYQSGAGEILSATRAANAEVTTRPSLSVMLLGTAWDGSGSQKVGFVLQSVSSAVGNSALVVTEAAGVLVARLRRASESTILELGPAEDVKLSWNGAASVLQISGRRGFFHSIIETHQVSGGVSDWVVYNDGSLEQSLQSSIVPGQTLNAAAEQTQSLVVWNDNDGNTYTHISKSGYLMTRKQTAPSDSDLVAGEFAVWLDKRSASPRVMFMAKDSSGSTRAGSIPLEAPPN